MEMKISKIPPQISSFDEQASVWPPQMDSSCEKIQVVGSIDPDQRNDAGEPRCCTVCYTTKTPLWRGGPCGPKSLCNACGIRYRKKKREELGLDVAECNNGGEKQKNKQEEVTLEVRMVGFGKEMVFKQRKVKRRRRMREEEKAAFLLLGLSSGVIYA